MWLSEGPKAAGRGRTLLAAAATATTLLLAACNVTPVYGPTPGGSAVSAELAAIYIPETGSRVAQIVRNRLISSFGGSSPAAPRYDMKLTVSTSGDIQALTRDQIKPLVSVRVQVSYDLIERSTNRQIARGSARASASYTQLNQAFANDRARLDAENRAAVAAADDIRLRVATVLAGGR
jgi:LPS-assembly lipoprotein